MRRRAFVRFVVIACCLAVIPAKARGQSDLTVTSGSQVTVGAEAFGAVSVSGTSPLGARSTLTVVAPITVASGLLVSERGLVVVEADVGLGSSSSFVYDGGTLDLASGTFAAEGLYLSGTGSFARSGGVYALHGLGLTDGASVTVAAGDQFLASGSTAAMVSLGSGALLTLQAALGGVGNAVDLSISGSAAGLVRTSQAYALGALTLADGAAISFKSGDSIATSAVISGGAALALEANLVIAELLELSDAGSDLSRTGATVTANTLSIQNGAAFTLAAGDSFDSLNVGGGSTLTLPSTTALPVLDVYLLALGGTISGLDVRPYDVGVLTLDATAIALRSGAVNDQVTDSVTLTNGATLTLEKNLMLTGAASFVYLEGPASGIIRGGNSVSVGTVALGNGASFTVDSGDSVTDGLSVSSFGDATTLTLDRSISLTGTTDRAVFLAGAAASIVRANPAATITGSGVLVTVTEGATFEIASGDSFPDAGVTVSGGGQLSNSVSQSFATIDVQGTGSRYQALSALSITSTSATSLTVGTGGVFAAAANMNVTEAVFDLGTLELLSGTFSADALALSGSGAFDRDPGAAYAVDGLSLASEATVTFTSADSIGMLTLDGLSGLTATSALGLDALSIAGGSVLTLTTFNGSGLDGYAWALRLPGDQQSALATWFAAGSITATGDWQVLFDDSSETTFTYVVAPVPEPTTMGMAMVGAAVVACGGWRKRRAVAHIREHDA